MFELLNDEETMLPWLSECKLKSCAIDWRLTRKQSSNLFPSCVLRNPLHRSNAKCVL